MSYNLKQFVSLLRLPTSRMDDLSAEQRATLASFLEITGSAAPDAVREILQAAGWDLEASLSSRRGLC